MEFGSALYLFEPIVEGERRGEDSSHSAANSCSKSKYFISSVKCCCSRCIIVPWTQDIGPFVCCQDDLDCQRKLTEYKNGTLKKQLNDRWDLVEEIEVDDKSCITELNAFDCIVLNEDNLFNNLVSLEYREMSKIPKYGQVQNEELRYSSSITCNYVLA